MPVFIIALCFAALESRALLFPMISSVGQGDFSFFSMPFALKEKIFLIPLVVVEGLALPTPYAVALLMTFYHALGGIFMFLLVRKYLDILFPNVTIATIAPYISMLVFMFFPWNIIGDAHVTLLLLRSLTPLVLLLFLNAFRKKSLKTLLLGTVILSLMQTMDPRAVLFVLPISFFVILVPELINSNKIGRRMILRYSAIVVVILTILSVPEILYRFPQLTSAMPVTTIANWHISSFWPNFLHAKPIEVMQGVSFAATATSFNDFVSQSPSYAGPINSALLIVFGVALSLPLLFFNYQEKKSKIAVLSIVGMIVISIFLFARFDDQKVSLPLIFQFLVPNLPVESPEILKTIVLMFRTERFLNLVLLVSLPLLIAIAMTTLFKSLKRTSFGKIFKHTIISLLLINVVLWSLPITASGNGPVATGGVTYEIKDRSLALSNIVSKLDFDPNIDRIVSMHQMAGGLPNIYFVHGVEGGVKQFMFRYTLDNKFSPLLYDGDYEFMADMLRRMGVRYVVVDGYKLLEWERPNPNDAIEYVTQLENNLDESRFFKYITSSGKIRVYEVVYDHSISIGSGIFVLGGLEHYRKLFHMVGSENRTDMSPVFVDTYFDYSIMLQLSWPLLIGYEKSALDLVAPFVLNHDNTIIVRPEKWLPEFNDAHTGWSAGYVTDTIGGTWYEALPQLDNYEWNYPYRSDYGFAYALNSHSVTTGSTNIHEGTYKVLARVLTGPDGGKINIEFDGVFSKTIFTKSDHRSSVFKWIDLGEHNLGQDTYKISLENIYGVNVINLIVLVPVSAWNKSVDLASNFLQDRNIIVIGDLNKNLVPRAMAIDQTIPQKNNSSSFRKLTDLETFFSGMKNAVYESVYGKEQSESLLYCLNEDAEMQRELRNLSVIDEAFYVFTDSETKILGSTSYAITTNSTKMGAWSWIRSESIDVKPGEKYLIFSNMRLDNAKQSHIAVEAQRQDGSIYTLASVPSGIDGTSEWVEYHKDLIIPPDTANIRFVLNAGWVLDPAEGSATTWFDDICIYKLPSGNNIITIPFENKSLSIKKSDKSLEDFISSKGRLDVKAAKIQIFDKSYNEYSITVSGNGEGILTIPEIYDGAWIITDEERIEAYAIPSTYTFVGFILKANEELENTDITIHNDRNRLLTHASYSYFIGISLVVFAALFGAMYERDQHHVQRICRKVYSFIRQLFV